MNQKLSILVLLCLISFSFAQLRPRNLQNSNDASVVANTISQIVEAANKTNAELVANATQIGESIWNASNSSDGVQSQLSNDVVVSSNGNGTNTITISNGNANLVFDNISDATVASVQQAYSDFSQNVNASNITSQVQQEIANGTVSSQEGLIIALAAISSESGKWSNETRDAVSGAISNITDYLNNLNSSSTVFGGSATQGVKSIWASLTNGANSTISSLWSNLTTSIESAANYAVNNTITSAISGVTGDAIGAAGGVTGDAIDAAGGVTGDAIDAAGGVTSDAIGAAGSVTNAATSAASNAVSGVLGGV